MWNMLESFIELRRAKTQDQDRRTTWNNTRAPREERRTMATVMTITLEQSILGKPVKKGRPAWPWSGVDYSSVLQYCS